MEYKSLSHMLDDIESHILNFGGVARSTDNPMRLRVGFSVGDELWEIRISSLVWNRFGGLNLPDDIRGLIRTAEGREEIARRLTVCTIFDA